jgi:hypothetical protein
MNTIAGAFDPWGPISSILYEIRDSDFVQNAIANTGIDIDWRPFSKADAYSHSTRIRALRRDITAAYAELDQDQRGLFAQIVVKAMLQRQDAEELRGNLIDRLADIGWTISQSGLLTTQDALISEQFFPANSEYDAYLAIRDLFATEGSDIIIVDAFIGTSLLITLRSLTVPAVSVKVLTIAKNLKPDFRLELTAFKKQVTNVTIEIRTTGAFHDRFIVIDDAAFYHVGASIKDVGGKAFMISRIEDKPNVANVRRTIAEAWTAGVAFQP